MTRATRKRLLLFIAAVAAVHFAFYCLPRYLTTRPRFDQEAYDEAVAILKEEVGAPAVESGAFSIPKAPVSCPYRGRMTIDKKDFLHEEWADTTLLLTPGASRLIRWCPMDWVAAFHRYERWFRAAGLTDDEARHIWAVLEYLRTVTGRAKARVAQSWRRPLVSQGNCAVDDTWFLRHRWLYFDSTGYDKTILLPHAVGLQCQARYLARLEENGRSKWSNSPDELVPALIAWFKRARTVGTGMNQGVGEAAVEYLALYGDRRALPVLRAISQRRHDDRQKAIDRITARFPFLRRFISSSPQWLEEDEIAIGMIELLAGKPPAEQFAIASKVTLSYPTSTIGGKPLKWLTHHHLDEWRRTVLDKFTSLSDDKRRQLIAVYPGARDGVNDDPRLARLAMSDPSPSIAYLAACELYRITGDKSALAVALQGTIPARNDSAASDAAQTHTFLLMKAYGGDRRPSDVADFFRTHLSAANAQFAFQAIGAAGGEANIAFLHTFVLDNSNAILLVRCHALMQIAQADPASAVDAATELLQPCVMTKMTDLLQDCAIVVLGHLGRSQVLPDLEAIAAATAGGPAAAHSNFAMDCENELPESWRYGRVPISPNALLAETIIAIRCRSAADPMAYLLSISNAERPSADQNACIPPILAERYDGTALERLLADEKYSAFQWHVYAALVLKRRAEEK